MRTALRNTLLAVCACVASMSSRADNCEALRAQIEDKIRAAGVSSLSVTVVENTASAPGKVVGSCGNGTKKIVYLQVSANGGANGGTNGGTNGSANGGTAAARPSPGAGQPPRQKAEPLLTECKDGSMSVGGTCKK